MNNIDIFKFLRKTIAVIFCFFTFQLLFAQFDWKIDKSDAFYQYRFFKIQNGSKTKVYNDIPGSPYLSAEPVKSIVYINDSSYNLILHYDIFEDEIEFDAGTSTFWLVKSDVKYLIYGETKLVVSDYSVNGENKLSYFEPLVTGKYQLLKRKKVKLLPAEPARAYHENIPERFSEPYIEYYIKYQETPALLITGKKSIKNLSPENYNKIAEFIKKEHIKLNKEKDLIKLVEYMNSI